MSSCLAAPSPWARKSTAPGRRRVSIRLRAQSQFTNQVAASQPNLEERGTKRTRAELSTAVVVSAPDSTLLIPRPPLLHTSSPVETSVKRMRLVEGEEIEERNNSLMRVQGDFDESIEEDEREDDHSGAIDPDLQVTSSYSSSSGESRSMDEDAMEEGSNGGVSEIYVEEEDIDDDDDDGQQLEVDRTDIFTSDEDAENEEDEYEYERWVEQQEEQKRINSMIDGPTDTLERMTRFRKLSLDLAQRFEMVPLEEPRVFTNRCRGMGPAGEVWSVLVHKDELHSICNEKFMEPHGFQRCRRLSADDPTPADPRSTLIDWMQDVCWAEKLHRETFHLAVDYVDRVMAKGPAMGMVVPIGQFQLLGTTALFLASKYEEIYPPKVEDIVQYTDHACNSDQVRQLEMIMLKVLEWELNVITPLQWAHLFLELLTGNPRPAATASSSISLLPQSQDNFFVEDDTTVLPVTSGSCARDDFMHVSYVMDVVILHHDCRKFTNRMLAAAVMHAVYDADDAIPQVTGLSITDRSVREAIEWVQPIVMYCETHKGSNLGLPKLDVQGIHPDAIHTIQLHRERVSTMKRVDYVMEDIVNLRKELVEREKRQRSAAIRLPH